MSNPETQPTLESHSHIRSLHDILSSDLSLVFIEPSSQQVESLEQKLRIAANFLGAAAPAIAVPERGLLTKPLTAEQLAVIGDQLDSEYGSHFTAMQDAVRRVTIHESGERMVNIREVFAREDVVATFSDIPINPTVKEWGGKPRIYWAREDVVAKVVKAARAYREIEISLHFEDGFRPEGVQEQLFQMVLDSIRRDNPNIEEKTLLNKARSMIAISPWIAGHKCGAAIDYTLRNSNGTELDLWHKYLQLGAKVALDFPFLTWEQYETRQLFAQVSAMAGLHVYQGEDWHVSANDAIAGLNAADVASYMTKYGPIRGFDKKTGEIIPHDPRSYYVNFDYV